MAKYNIYGLGAALVDTEIQVTDEELQQMAIEKGLMTLVDEDRQLELLDLLSHHLVTASRACGGSACNTIIGAANFGSRAYYSCKVASDENGDFYLNAIREAGVDANVDGDRESGVSGKCLVLITPDAERTMNTYLGVSETLSVDDVNAQAIADSEYFYMEGYLVTSPTGRAAAIKAREIAESNAVKTSISLSDPGMVEFFKDGLVEMIGDGVDLLFCNKEEALGWAATASLDDAVTAIKSVAKTFAITLGAQGALVYDGAELINIAPHKVSAVDTNGAGDMFAGAFIYALTAGHSFEKAGQLASKASAELVTQFGPRLSKEQQQDILKSVF